MREIKLTIDCEGSQPRLVMDFGQPSGKNTMEDQVAQSLKMVIGHAIAKVFKPAIKGMGFGTTEAEARKEAEKDVALNEAVKNAPKTPVQ